MPKRPCPYLDIGLINDCFYIRRAAHLPFCVTVPVLFGVSTFFPIQDDELFQIGYYQNMVGKGRKTAWNVQQIRRISTSISKLVRVCDNLSALDDRFNGIVTEEIGNVAGVSFFQNE